MKNRVSKVFYLKAEKLGYGKDGFLDEHSNSSETQTGASRNTSEKAAHPVLKRGHTETIERLLAPFRSSMNLSDTDQTAVKFHPGEEGNTSYVTPYETNLVIKGLDLPEGRTFLTDTTVLYPGRRMNAVDYTQLAHEHGFGPPNTPPFLVADGLRGTDEVEVSLPEKWNLPPARLAQLIPAADNMVVISHFKGHLLSSFGGALKNLGMGCASRGGKLFQHSSVKPRIKKSKCIACGVCAQHCPADAILVEDTAHLDKEKCIGCGECLQRCPTSAIGVSWNQEKDVFMKRMSAYAAAVVRSTQVSVYINFIVRVAPDCDCMKDTGAFLVNDIGIVASTDPVAIDTASLHLVNNATPPPSSPVAQQANPGVDKFIAYHPSTKGELVLEYAEHFGIGTRKYELIEV